MYCNKCGQEVDERDLYCPHCSSEINNHTNYNEDESGDVKISDEKDEGNDAVDTLIDINEKMKKSEDINVDQEYEAYKKSVFNNHNNEYFEFEKEDEGGLKGAGNKLLIVLIVITFITATTLAAKYYFFADYFNKSNAEIPGETNEQQNEEAEEKDIPSDNTEENLSQRQQIFQGLEALNYNIQEIRNNENLKYNADENYKEEDVLISTPVADEVWKEIEGKSYYYNEAIIKALVQFNSKWIDYVNNNDKAVLSLVEKDSKAYKNAATFNREGILEEFLLFEIGEIRRGKNGYYAWTHERIKVIEDGESEIREYNWIYKLVEGEYDFFISNYY